MTGLVQVTLNSFVRKTQNSDVLKIQLRSTGAQLTRNGRSRNWMLKANHQQILDIIQLVNLSGEDSWLWLVKKLSEHKRQLSHEELLKLARQNPKITVTELMSVSDCKLVEARKVLDQLEWE